MSVVVPQKLSKVGECVPIKSNITHHSNVDCQDIEIIREKSLVAALVDEVENSYQHNVFADLFVNVDREENDSIQTFVAGIDQKRPDCHSLGYVDPVLDDPQNESLEARLFQVPSTIRQSEMYYGRLTGNNSYENSRHIISSGYRMDSDIQENLVGPSEQPMILEVHKQLDNLNVVQQQLDRQKLLTEDEALIKQIAETSAMKEALSMLMQTGKFDPVVRGNSKAFPCPECGKKFSWKASLVAHSIIHTGERPFECGQCGVAFYHRSKLASHQRTHSGERPFRCHICNDAFARNGTLSRHLLIHANKKPYVCHICKQAFRHSTTLSSHMYIHSGEMPYKCNVCEEAFRHRHELFNHRKIHAREDE